MKVSKAFVVGVAVLLIAGFDVRGQGYTEFQFLFSGTAYETNAFGKIVGVPITDQTLLQDRARLGQIADASSLAIVYHINGNALGDTIDIISNATGRVLVTELGLYFGSDGSLGRTAVTNAAQTAQRRVDYIYTDNNSTYRFDNDDSVGMAMTGKCMTVTNGSTNMAVSGSMSWGVAPQGTNGPILCIGNFSAGRPVF